MKKSLPYIIQGTNVTVIHNNTPYTLSEGAVGYQQLIDAIKAGDWDAFPGLISPTKAIATYSLGRMSIINGEFHWDQKPMRSAFSTRIMEMHEQGFPIEPMVNFMANCAANPSPRAVDELYGYLEANNQPITEDGCFIAYKRVRLNYKDIHSGTMDNSVGKTPSMDRGEVNDDREVTCSTGLHFCGMSYLKHFPGGRIVIVKVNPADVVSIPKDYNAAKGRACKYEVIGELENDLEEDKLAATSVYVESETEVEESPDFSVWVNTVSLRQAAAIHNRLVAGATLKKFSTRADLIRVMSKLDPKAVMSETRAATI